MKKLTIFVLAILIPLLVGCGLSGKESASITDATQAPKATALTDGTYEVNTKASTLYWEAYKVVGGHMGGISLKSGELIVQNGQPQSGSFVIDMTSITDTDVEDEGTRTSLVNHLKSDDFFGVADYPTARFDVTRVMPYEGEGDYDYTVEGDLSIRDITDTVSVNVRIENGAGEKISAYAKASVDRTKYGIDFRSGSFFENLGDTLIKDEFTLEIELSADRVQKDL